VVEPGIALSCWDNNIVTNGAITVNIATTGSTAGVAVTELVMRLGPVRPWGFVCADGIIFQ
jgi:hypothetical protein